MLLRLKLLELQGYKTFANRSLFEYSGAITAIVGPNGSGKSNIADSIRWVLGEQSYSLLRGKKTEDMIFSGSDHRSRASMASATMVFDNSDGWLPIDFSEVAITRRAYRDGTNEYLINGSRVRLKDVAELLGKSGLAERTYTVIGQGLVDAALSLKAEERRKLFEEAAGIGLYRGRREEALRRLESTQRNLERIQDIMAELTPRLKNLDKQARRLQEYEQVKNDLRVLLLDWYGYHWHNAQDELNRLNNLYNQHESALQQAKDQHLQQESKMLLSNESVNQKQSELNSYHRMLSELFIEREGIAKEKAIVDERLRSNLAQSQSIERELSHLEDDFSLQQEVILATQVELEDIKQEYSESLHQYEQANLAYEQRMQDRVQLERELDTSHQEMNQIQAKCSELIAIQKERTQRKDRYLKAIEEKKQLLVTLHSKTDEFQAKQEEINNEIRIMGEDRKKLEYEFNEKISHQESIEKKIQVAKGKNQELKTQLSSSKINIEIIEQAETNLTGYSNGVKVLQEAVKKNQFHGFIGLIGGLLEITPKFEHAIASTLGELVNTVVVDSDHSLQNALDLLQDKGVRGIVFPLKTIEHKTLPKSLLELPGFIGPASNEVRSSLELRPVIDALLGNVIIVKDRQVAQKVFELVPDGIVAVTVKGEVYYSTGAVAAGIEGKSTVLSRNRQRNEYNAILLETQKLIDKTIRDLEKFQQEQQENIRNLNALRMKIDVIKKKSEEKKGEFLQAEEALNRLRNQQNLIAEQIKNYQNDILSADQELLEVESELLILQSELKTREQVLLSLSKQLGEKDIQDFHSQLLHWNAVLKVSERAKLDATQRLSDRQDTLSRIIGLITEAKTRKPALESNFSTLEETKRNLNENEQQLIIKIEETQKMVSPCEDHLQQLEWQHEKLMDEISLAKKKIDTEDHQFSQVRINLVRQQERFEALSRRIEDDFGLVSFNYSDMVSGQNPLPLDGMVEKLPYIRTLSPELEESLKRQKGLLRRMGPINPEAKAEYEEVNKRFQFMLEQVNDLDKAEKDIRQVILELDQVMHQEFKKVFDQVASEFKVTFSRLFNGGSARLILTDADELTDTGIEIEARLPGRRTQGLSLLSGGERSLTATALIFSLLKVSPTPFCLLDEVDAMLDEANVGRFRELLHELSQNTQFIIVTHNRNTVQVADIIYGITMGRDSSSQVISLRLDDIEKVI